MLGLIPWLATAFSSLFSGFARLLLRSVGLAIVPLAIKLLSSLGIGFVTYKLGSLAITSLFNQVKLSLGGLSADMLVFISIARLDDAIAVVFGALAARLAYQGFSSGSKTSVNLGGRE